MNLTSPSQIAALFEEYGFSFKKKFGQNFLINNEIPKKIAISSVPDTNGPKACIEIGPGIGTMTYELSQIYDKVYAFEIDSDLIPILEVTLKECNNVTVINNDILKVDLNSFISDNLQGYTVTVCANLPYYITTPIIMQLFESNVNIDRVAVMMQKEVADRLCAKAGSENYGAITPNVEYYAKVKKLFDVNPSNFMPRPTVTSTVVLFEIRKEKTVFPKSEEIFFKTIKGAFAQRRKSLSNSLSAEFQNLDKQILIGCIEEAGLKANIRGEALTLADFSNLSDKIFDKINS